MNNNCTGLARIVHAGVLAVAITACHGGGGDNPEHPAPAVFVPSAAQGLYAGTTDSSRTVTGIVLDTGQFWVIYSSRNVPNSIAGVVEGNGTTTSGSFSSSNAKDFNFETPGVFPATVSASYAVKSSLAGTVTYTSLNQPVTFTSTYDVAFDQTPAVSLITGTYSGQAIAGNGIDTVTFTLLGTGVISGSGTSGCQFTGTVAPHANGNVYDVAITFGGGVCANGTNTVIGVGYFDLTAKTMISAALDSSRANGFLVLASKP